MDSGRLSVALGYRFQDESLLRRALTHRSAGAEHNERFEFLGDALLNFAAAACLFERFPRLPEGDLSRLRSAVVRESALAEIARGLGLSDHLQLGIGELRSGGFRRDSILADAVEALIGAVLLDGGVEPARALCLRLLAPLIEKLPDASELKDPKTRLQEELQAAGRPLPQYEVLSEEGPPHRRRFAVRCGLCDDAEAITRGEAGSRREAEQRAAQHMLDALHEASRSTTRSHA